MDQYLDYSAFQDQAEDSGDGSLHQSQHFGHAVNAPLQDQPRGALYHPTVPPNMSCEVKPRLTKDQHDVLEAHFQKQHKPSTNVKRGFAESLNVSLDKVNVSNQRLIGCVWQLTVAELVPKPPRKIQAGCEEGCRTGDALPNPLANLWVRLGAVAFPTISAIRDNDAAHVFRRAPTQWARYLPGATGTGGRQSTDFRNQLVT
jgi:hypothetical protein